MALSIATEQRSPLHYIGVPISTRFSEFGAPGGPNHAVPRIYQWLGEQHLTPQGGPLFVYRHIGSSDDSVDLTVAVPVAGPAKPSDDFVLGSLPAGTYVVGRHVGSPDALPTAHEEVKDWAAATGHLLDVRQDDNGDLWTGHAEHFLTDPAEEPDRSRWITELLFKTV